MRTKFIQKRIFLLIIFLFLFTTPLIIWKLPLILDRPYLNPILAIKVNWFTSKDKNQNISILYYFDITKKGIPWEDWEREMDAYKGDCKDYLGLRRCYEHHSGIDFILSPGTKIIAAASGIVLDTQSDKNGKRIFIDHGGGYYTEYGHLEKFLVNKGGKVLRGEVIATLENSLTDIIFVPHLHFMLWYRGKPIDPFSDYTADRSNQVKNYWIGGFPLSIANYQKLNIDAEEYLPEEKFSIEQIDRIVADSKDERLKTEIMQYSDIAYKALQLRILLFYKNKLFSRFWILKKNLEKEYRIQLTRPW